MRTLLAALSLLLAASSAVAQDTPPPDSGRVYELEDVETQPRPVNVADLRAALDAGFPPERLAQGAGGTVNVSFVVGADGAVRQARVVSSTDAAFDAPTLSALAVLRLSPATVGGTPVATRVELPIQWQAPAPVAQAEEGVVSTAEVTEQGERLYTMSDVVVEARTYEMSEVDHRPEPRRADDLRHQQLRNQPPETRGQQSGRATVWVRFRVNVDGTTDAFTVIRSTDTRYDAPSIAALRNLRFLPGKLDEQSVAVWMELPLHW
ncbi:TonB family protein [Longimicrobium sp.]|uniref:TonB family protein n=1 Tax=Longimicrobium sp. TaxID=2029185 RepID=UPI003B3B05A9